MYSLNDALIVAMPGKTPFKGVLVDIFKKGVLPDKAKVAKYYNIRENNKNFKKFHAVAEGDRLVIKRKTTPSGYTIVPETLWGFVKLDVGPNRKDGRFQQVR